MSDHIPVEIITSILNKVTNVKDLQRFKLVSKQWLSIIDSDDFIRCHLRRSEVASSNLGLFIVDISSDRSYFCSDDIAGGFHFRRHPMLEKYLGSVMRTKLLGCCHGVVCCWLPSSQPSELFILNPSTGEGHYVSFIHPDRIEFLLGYGFGYDPLSDDYIAVFIYARLFCWYVVEFLCVRAGCYRDDFISDIPRDEYMSVLRDSDRRIGVFVSGALHWIACESGQLIALDFGSNTFRSLPQPCYNADGDRMFGVGVLESCLCVCVVYEHLTEVELWIMGDYGEEGSWYRCYNIQFGRNIFKTSLIKYIIPIGHSRTGQILFMGDGGWRFVWFDPLSNMVQDVELDDNILGEGGFFRDAFYCLQSLVKIFPRG